MKSTLRFRPRAPRRGRSPRGGALALLLVVLGLAACGKKAPRGPSALLITLDTTRADALSCFGGVPGTTPHLDGLAAESIAYDGAHSVAPLTTPSHASMLTGLYPLRHSVRDNDVWALPEEVDTLAELAREGGIQTSAVIAALVMHERFGLNQGFDEYTRPQFRGSTGSHVYSQRDAAEETDAALLWLEKRDPSRPFFLWVHYFDPHAPYTPPPGRYREGALAGSPYHGEVAYMDAQVGRLLDRLREEGILDDTFVMVVGDHGEGLGQHGEVVHGALLYETTMRVPFLLRYPDGYGAGTRSNELVSVVDVFPTMLDALGLPPRPDIDGLSLYKKHVPEDRGIYFETYAGYLGFGYSPLVGWMDARGKYLLSPRPELYDISEDPTEITNLVEERSELVAEYEARLNELDAKPKQRRHTGKGLEKEMMDALRGLGYSAVGGVRAEFPSIHEIKDLHLYSPAVTTEVHEAALHGINLFNDRRYAEAEKELEEVLTVIPNNPCALHYLAISRINQLRQEDAIEPLEKLLALRPELGFAHFYLSMCYWKVENFEKGWKNMERALALEPDNLEYMAKAVAMLRELGRIQEALAIDRRVRELDTEGKYADPNANR